MSLLSQTPRPSSGRSDESTHRATGESIVGAEAPPFAVFAAREFGVFRSGRGVPGEISPGAAFVGRRPPGPVARNVARVRWRRARSQICAPRWPVVQRLGA